MKLPVVGLSAGGHTKTLIDALQLIGGWNIVGLLDLNPTESTKSVLGVPILGNDELLPQLYTNGIRHAFIGLGSVGNNRPRKNLYQKVKQYGFEIIQIYHPTAIVSKSTIIGEGTVILAGAIVNTNVRIGKNVIINTGVILEHDCVIEDHVHIASGAQLAGGVHVRQDAFIGMGASVLQSKNIGQHSVVGAGAVVIKDVESSTTVAGVPARVI